MLTTTRSKNSSGIEVLISNVKCVLDKHVFSVIKLDNVVCSGCGTYAVNKDELNRLKRLKIKCYGEVGRKFKTMGFLSSKTKKESIVNALRYAVQVTDQYNVGVGAAIGNSSSRMSRGVVEVSVLRAVLNGLQKMKLNDERMPSVFDDSDE